MTQCPVCNGTGIQTLTIHHEDQPTETIEHTCFHCNGTTQLTQAQVDQIEWENAQWCKCSSVEDTIYYADGTHPDCHKHHWRCGACGLITQIG